MSIEARSSQQIEFSPVIPPELIFRIISQLDPLEDKHSLAQCCLLSTSFVTEAQKQLYNFIYSKGQLTFEPEKLSFAWEESKTLQGLNLCRTVSSNKRLATFVRRLHIQLIPARLRQKTSNYMSLNLLLPHLTHLEDFRIREAFYPEDWSVLTNQTRHILMDVLELKTIRTVSLNAFSGLIYSLFNGAKNLQVLQISQIHAFPPGSKIKTYPAHESSFVYLSALSITGSLRKPATNGFLDQGCALKLSRLKKLEFLGYRLDASDAISVLGLCSRTLTHLTFTIPADAPMACPPDHGTRLSINQIGAKCPILPLNTLLSLTYLMICGLVSPPDSDKVEQFCLPWLGAVLDRLQSSRNAECSGVGVDLRISLAVPIPLHPNLSCIIPWYYVSHPIRQLRRSGAVSGVNIEVSLAHKRNLYINTQLPDDLVGSDLLEEYRSNAELDDLGAVVFNTHAQSCKLVIDTKKLHAALRSSFYIGNVGEWLKGGILCCAFVPLYFSEVPLGLLDFWPLQTKLYPIDKSFDADLDIGKYYWRMFRRAWVFRRYLNVEIWENQSS